VIGSWVRVPGWWTRGSGSRWSWLLATTLVVGACGAGCGGSSEATPSPKAGTAGDRVERGRYLVAIMDCGACHTPMKMGAAGPEPDLDRLLSGHPEGLEVTPVPSLGGPWVWAGTGTNTAFAGPWGVSFAVNLTPDLETGLGVVDEAVFVKAMRTGKHYGAGRDILPPMPWPAYAQATDDDLGAIHAYLRSIRPIRNRVPDAMPPLMSQVTSTVELAR